MEMVQETRAQPAQAAAPEETRVQSAAWLLELSPDWIVERASENIHPLLGESHVTLIDEPLGRFVQAQALHDLRNLFARLSGTTGIGRAYRVRLTQDHDRVDIAFQQVAGRVLLEAVPCAPEYGEAFGTVGGLAAGLADARGQALLDAAARRMRALTGYDRVSLKLGERSAESSRGGFAGAGDIAEPLPLLISDIAAPAASVFPRDPGDRSVAAALLCAPRETATETLQSAGVRALLRIPFEGGQFRCESRTARPPNIELHAAAELFAQMFAMRLEIEGLKAG